VVVSLVDVRYDAAMTKQSPSARSSKSSRRPVAVDDLLRLRIPGDPQPSPDGSRVLFTLRETDPTKPGRSRRSLWIVDVDGRRGAKPFTAGPRDGHGRWSPDGSRVAFIRADEAPGTSNGGKDRPQIWVMDADGGEARQLTALPAGDLAGFKWSPDGKQFAISFRPADAAFTEAAAVARRDSGASEPPRVIDDIWYRLDGDGYFAGQRHALHLIDALTGETRLLDDRDALGAFTFDFAPDGRTIAITTNRHKRAMYEPWRSEIVLIDVASGKGRPLQGLPEGPKHLVLWSPDGRSIAWTGRADREDGLYSTENLLVWCADVKGDTAQKIRCLTGDDDHCLMAAILSDTSDADFGPCVQWTRDSKRLLMKLGVRGQGHVFSVPAAGGTLKKHTRGGGDHSLGCVAVGGARVGMVVSDFTAPPEVAIADVTDGPFRVRTLTRFNRAWCDEVTLVEPISHTVRAEDGHSSQLWVMRPPTNASGKSKPKRGPAVVMVHGGPHAQYGEVFFHEMQVLVARGYTVLFGNPRGSKGYGRDHCAAIRGAWGDRDWADVLAYLEFAQDDHAIDPNRIAISGGSYGGYMATWAIGNTTAFRCAIADRCVANLLSMAGNSDHPDRPDGYWPGAVWEDWEQRWEMSPIRHIGNAKTPTLLIHSEGDLRCNVEQAEQVFTALSTLGVPTRLIRYPASTSHGMSRNGPPDLRRHRLDAMLEWLGQWMD